MIPTAEFRRQQAARASERFHHMHVRMPGCLSREDARRLTEADGPEPRPTRLLDDPITFACERLFQDP